MAALAVAMFASPSRAADQTWSDVSTTINGLIDEGVSTFKAGDAQGGKDKVNDAYYKHYEITGMEKQVMSRISGSRVSQVEMEFSLLKKAMADNDSAAVDQHLSTLTNYIREDANSLDGYTGKAADKTADTSGTSPWIAQFLPSLLVILREGMEAILVVAAVLAYLAKAGHKKKAPIVWGGVVLAFGLSIGLAFLFSYVTSLAGANQELLEGFAALFAVVMLIWVSNWMINKSSNKAWDEYIKKQTDASLSSGSLLGLAFISFLAVLRDRRRRGRQGPLRVDRPGGRPRGPRRHLPAHPVRGGAHPAAPLLHHYLAADGLHGLHVHGFWYWGTSGGGRRVPDTHLRLPHH